MNKQELLENIAREISECKKCKLCEGRNLTVPGDGNPDSSMVFVGESAGASEDELGKPFVGRAGKLLTKMIESMGLKRGDVFITNSCRCRPPGNRKPEPEEMSSCLPFLIRELKVIQPKLVVALGATAMETLLGKGAGITKRHGKIEKVSISGIELNVIPVYHPSYLLRNPAAKIEAAEDLAVALRCIKE